MIPKSIFDEMIAHCRNGYPNEACGILAGKGMEISKVYTLTNAEPSPVSYLMDTGEQFRAMKDMREKELAMVAIFHSHPFSPAYPSAKDVRLAFYEDSFFVIVSLAGEEPETTVFSIRGGEVAEVPFKVT
jgi:proteasome lid subunit RPN8/RPN11